MRIANEITAHAGTSPKVTHVKRGLPAKEKVALAKAKPKVLEGEIVNRFDYATITETTDRNKLQKIAKAIHGSIRKERHAPFEIGKALNEAKAMKGFGHFDRWIAAEFQFSKRNADQKMALDRVFGHVREKVSHVPLKLLYAIAEGRDGRFKELASSMLSDAKAERHIAKSEVQRHVGKVKETNAKGKPAHKTEDASAEAKNRENAALSAVTLLRDKLDDDFPRFVEWFHDAGEAFTIALKDAA